MQKRHWATALALLGLAAGPIAPASAIAVGPQGPMLMVPSPTGLIGQSNPDRPATSTRPRAGGCEGMQLTKVRPLPIESDSRRYKLEPKQVRKSVKNLTKALPWHEDLESAATAARESGKPILWIQALGDLEGYA